MNFIKTASQRLGRATVWARASLYLAAALFLLSALAAGLLWKRHADDTDKVADGSKYKMLEAYGDSPMRFEANDGQFDERAKFIARGSGCTIFFTSNEAVFALREQSAPKIVQMKRNMSAPTGRQPSPGPESRTVMRMRLVDANPNPSVKGEEELPTRSNYFAGDRSRWRTGVANYRQVRYEEVYPGIDQVYYGNQQRLEYDFVVSPEADPRVIALSFDGLASLQGRPALEIEANGDLILHTVGGDLRQPRPVIYQQIAGARRDVDGGYRILADNRVGFALSNYDTTQPLIIDPVLVYSTYLGGSGYTHDEGLGITVDGGGNAYITGITHPPDFPVTAGAFQGTQSGAYYDGFVGKLNAAGSALVYSTYLGGSNQDDAFSLAVDNNSNAYVTGYTFSTDFPIANAFDSTHTGVSFDAFVTKIGTPVSNATLVAVSDSFLRSGADDTNEGANERLRIQSSGNNRAVVRFDLSGISTVGLQSATLVLNIAENSNNWGTSGRLVDSQRLLADWTEGNGRNDTMVPGVPSFRGSGAGGTWRCASDSEIANQAPNCASSWNGGTFAAATAAGVLHTNGQLGEVSWNVTADVLAGAGFGWLIRKQQESQPGQVRYYSREGAMLAGNPNLAPRLILVYTP